jgi:acyl carrier protein
MIVTATDKIIDILVEALSIDEMESVKLDSRLVQDLGAESIDFIDIFFRIEQEFGIENASNMFPFEYVEKEILDSSGKLIDDEVRAIKVDFPHIDDELFELVERTGDKSMLFCVDTIHKYVELNAK